MNSMIQESLYKGNFQEIVNLTKDFSREEFLTILKKLAYQEGVVVYALINYLMLQENLPEYHALAAHLFALPFCFYEGAASAGLFHAKEAARLAPKDISNLELLLYFNRIPEQVLGKDEAIIIAKEVLRQKPDSEAAKEVLFAYKLL